MNIVLRCDATADTGLGHLSRCLALAEGLRRAGHAARFLGRCSPGAVRMIRSAGFQHDITIAETGTQADADLLAELAIHEQAGVVADSYAVDVPWLARIADCGVRVVLIDDFARLSDYSTCAGVINLTVDGTRARYPGLAPGAVAAGPTYLLVRENVIKVREARRGAKRSGSRVLIALGGEDCMGMTLPIYREIFRILPGADVRAITSQGPSLARGNKLPVDQFPELANDLAAQYLWADRCVSGGGLTKYECAYLGIPTAIFSQTPDQQTETETFCARGLGFDLTPGGNIDVWQERLKYFLTNGRAITAVARESHAPFVPEGTDRAAKLVQQWLSGCPALARLPA